MFLETKRGRGWHRTKEPRVRVPSEGSDLVTGVGGRGHDESLGFVVGGTRWYYP